MFVVWLPCCRSTTGGIIYGAAVCHSTTKDNAAVCINRTQCNMTRACRLHTAVIVTSACQLPMTVRTASMECSRAQEMLKYTRARGAPLQTSSENCKQQCVQQLHAKVAMSFAVRLLTWQTARRDSVANMKQAGQHTVRASARPIPPKVRRFGLGQLSTRSNTQCRHHPASYCTSIQAARRQGLPTLLVYKERNNRCCTHTPHGSCDACAPAHSQLGS